MPEGHTLHRYATEHRKLLRGNAVAASSPQGRFAAGAAQLDGRVCEGVDAYGKHLFYRWDGNLILHVHLGLYGVFRRFDDPHATPPATSGTRLELRVGQTTLRLSGPTACDLIDPAEEAAMRARLGPDPLRRGADAEAVWTALQRRTTPIGAALLDQSIIAGVGNVFRAEALFLCGLAPQRPARDVSREEFDCLWSTLVRMLRQGVRDGSIITVDPAELGISRRKMTLEDWRYVYRRTGLPCRRCATPIQQWELGTRQMYACPVCQPAATS